MNQKVKTELGVAIIIIITLTVAFLTSKIIS